MSHDKEAERRNLQKKKREAHEEEVHTTQILTQFARLYNTAPLMPQPLKSSFEIEHITVAGLLDEARMTAPLNEDEEALIRDDPESELVVITKADKDDKAARYRKRKLVVLRWARDYAKVHRELELWYKYYLDKAQTLQVAISSVNSTLLAIGHSLPLPGGLLDIVVAGTTLCLGILKCGIQIAAWDDLQQSHGVAAVGFEELRNSIETRRMFFQEDAHGDTIRAKTEEEEEEEITHLARQTMANSARQSDAELRGSDRYIENEAEHKMEFNGSRRWTNWGGQNSHLSGFLPRNIEFLEVTPVIHRLRTMYREACEYHIAHGMYESKLQRIDIRINLFHLVVSSVLSTVLLLAEAIPFGSWITIGLSFILTSINAAISRLKLVERISEHRTARITFAGLQVSFGTSLMVDGSQKIRNQIDANEAKWHDCQGKCLKLTFAQLRSLRKPENREELLCPNITGDWIESDSSCLAHCCPCFSTHPKNGIVSDDLSKPSSVRYGCREVSGARRSVRATKHARATCVVGYEAGAEMDDSLDTSTPDEAAQLSIEDGINIQPFAKPKQSRVDASSEQKCILAGEHQNEVPRFMQLSEASGNLKPEAAADALGISPTLVPLVGTSDGTADHLRASAALLSIGGASVAPAKDFHAPSGSRAAETPEEAAKASDTALNVSKAPSESHASASDTAHEVLEAPSARDATAPDSAQKVQEPPLESDAKSSDTAHQVLEAPSTSDNTATAGDVMLLPGVLDSTADELPILQ